MTRTTELLRRDDGVVEVPGDPAVEERIAVREFQGSDAIELLGCAFGAFCLTWLVYERLTPLSGGLGFFVSWYALFLAAVWFVVRDRLGPLEARDRLARVVVASVALGLLIPLGLIVGYTFARGFHALRPQFFVQDQSRVGPLSPATEGGGSAGIVGSLEMVGLATLMSVPLGILTAVFLNEIGGRLARPVRMIVDAMSAIPSIVAGLFIYAAFILALHQRQTGFAAALSLAVLMLPTVTRTAEVVLRLVPGGLREASLALGGTEWSTVRRVVLPTARTGLLTAVILGVARVIGETAPLILTALGNTSLNANPLKGNQDALPLMIYRLIRFPQTASIERAWTGALVLLGIVLVLFIVARLLGGRGPGHIGRIKRYRLARKGLA
ncbi:MAG: phosphate transporter, permease protein PstA [Actinomycetia bacterium]|jgi:phosphate transport system permease protein|nr:phosphate transporter, permease protein PstA [Actinomycetes bacterium]MDQ1461710.1 phosphate transport system permease protein [Actinomycetota bacterium]